MILHRLDLTQRGIQQRVVHLPAFVQKHIGAMADHFCFGDRITIRDMALTRTVAQNVTGKAKADYTAPAGACQTAEQHDAADNFKQTGTVIAIAKQVGTGMYTKGQPDVHRLLSTLGTGWQDLFGNVRKMHFDLLSILRQVIADPNMGRDCRESFIPFVSKCIRMVEIFG
jgi:hypothetical protein